MSNELQTERRVEEDRRSHQPPHAMHAPFETPNARAIRIALARAFPVRIAPMREALLRGSITKLART